MGPPENELGVALPMRHVLFRTADLVVALLGLVAYTNGVELQVVLRRRSMPDEPDPMHVHMRSRHLRGHELAPEVFRFGIEFADGRKATNVGFRFPPGGEEPDQPALMERGSSGGGRSWSFGYWLWPLPPPGPLRVVVEWPAAGVPLTSIEIDGAPLAAAARSADVLWPDDDGPSGPSATSYVGSRG
jgi:hypothetical protein